MKDASVAEVRAATAKLTASWHKKPKTPAQSAVMAAFAKVESLRDVKAHEHDGLITFTAVPIGAMDRFIRALSSAKLPLPSPAPAKTTKQRTAARQ